MIDIFSERIQIPHDLSVEQLQERILLIENTLQIYKLELHKRTNGEFFLQKAILTMHYVIMKWHNEHLKWIIVHYSHNTDDMLNMMRQFPEPEYVHLIDMRWLKQHEVMMQVKAAREKFAQQQIEYDRKKLEAMGITVGGTTE